MTNNVLQRDTIAGMDEYTFGDPRLPARFWAKVEQTSTCWLWKACLDASGYGSFRANGRGNRAHRFAYEALVGPIPAGLVTDHLCRVRNCVNPAHLEPVTNAENVLRGEADAARNARKTQCDFGHPFDESNTIHLAGHRACKKCRNRYQNERRKRNLARKAAERGDDLLICVYCGRTGRRGFVISSGNGDGRDTYACSATPACDRRQRSIEHVASLAGSAVVVGDRQCEHGHTTAHELHPTPWEWTYCRGPAGVAEPTKPETCEHGSTMPHVDKSWLSDEVIDCPGPVSAEPIKED